MDLSREEEEAESAQGTVQRHSVTSPGTRACAGLLHRERRPRAGSRTATGRGVTVPSLQRAPERGSAERGPLAQHHRCASVTQHPLHQDVGPGARVGSRDIKAEPLPSTQSQAGRGNRS